MEYTKEEMNKTIELVSEIKNVVVRSHVSANQKIRKILDLYEQYDPDERLWDALHRRAV